MAPASLAPDRSRVHVDHERERYLVEYMPEAEAYAVRDEGDRPLGAFVLRADGGGFRPYVATFAADAPLELVRGVAEAFLAHGGALEAERRARHLLAG
jgi:hypothetical protein